MKLEQWIYSIYAQTHTENIDDLIIETDVMAKLICGNRYFIFHIGISACSYFWIAV